MTKPLSLKELKIIAKEIKKIDQEHQDVVHQKRVQKDTVKAIDMFNKRMISNRKQIVGDMIIEMLDDNFLFDEDDGLDCFSYVSIIYHIDNDLYEKLSEYITKIKKEISNI